MFALLRSAVLAAALPLAGIGRAALPVDLEVAVVQAAPLGAMQQWGQRLSELDLAGVRLRGAHAGDKPSIRPVGAGEALRFRVVGVLNQRDQLVLPGGVFGQGDMAQLKKFLEQVPEAQAEQGVERGAFGLTKHEFAQVYDDLSRVLTDTTVGVAPAALVADLTAGLSVPLAVDADARTMLDRAGPLAVELKDMTSGTALALALRTAGLGLAPQHPRGGKLELRIARLVPRVETWPVGWSPEKTPRQSAPGMYRFTTIEISGHSLQQAVAALAPHMGLPLLFDEHLMAERGIDLAKVQVKFPNRRTYVRRALDNVLSQGHLTGEVRVDEAGRAFYWISQFGPDNPPAKDH